MRGRIYAQRRLPAALTALTAPSNLQREEKTNPRSTPSAHWQYIGRVYGGIFVSNRILSSNKGASQVVLVVKEPTCQGKRPESQVWPLGSGRSPGGGRRKPLQSPCLEIPWTEEPGRLQSMGSQRVRHSWSDLAHPATNVNALETHSMIWRNITLHYSNIIQTHNFDEISKLKRIFNYYW